MKFEIESAKLRPMLQLAVRTIKPKPMSTIEGCYKLKAVSDGLILETMDTDERLRAFIPALVKEEGCVITDAKIMTELVSKLDSKILTMESDKDLTVLTVSYNGNHAKIHIAENTGFMPFPELKADKTLIFKRETFDNMVKKTSFAAALDTKQPVFTGINLITEGKNVITGATDTHIAALKIDEHDVKENCNIIIPARILSKVLAVKADKEAEVKITIDNNMIAFEQDNITILSRLIMGSFPSIERVIPKTFAVRFELDKKKFLSAVEHISVFDKGEYKKLFLAAENDCVTLKMSSELGEGTECIPCKTSDQKFSIAFNARYFISVLNSIEADSVLFEANSPITPALFSDVNDSTIRYVITPLRVPKMAA